MANSVLCVKCGKWIHGRYVKVKRATPRLGRDFVCGQCKKQVDGLVEPVEELCEEIETVRGFCYLGDRVNASGGCEAAVIARAGIGWVKFRECGELLNSKRFSLKMKGMFFWIYERLAMLYGSETWCLRENEMAILRRTERAMVRAMCGAKLMEKKRTKDLMEMLGLKETVVQMAKANGVRWYGHVLRRDDGQFLRKALEFELKGKRKRGGQKKTWKTQVEKEGKSVGLEKKDAMNQARWRVGWRDIAAKVGTFLFILLDNGFAVPVAPPSSPDPRYDWYQNDKIVTISVYTKKKDLRLEDIILELKDGKDFNAIFILGIKSFQIHLVLSNVVTCQQVRISGATGKADVLLTKETSGVKWTDLGQGLLGNNSLKLHKDRESRLWDCRVVSVEAVTHNCKLFCCELPDGIVMRVPIGHHIHLHRDVEGMKISRPYTVVLPSLRFSLDEREHDGRRFYLMIKIYPDGTLTPTLSAIDVGDILQISDYSGDFKESRLIEARDIILIAGGTAEGLEDKKELKLAHFATILLGQFSVWDDRRLTPMIRLIRRAVLENSSTEKSVKLLFANNQEKDILWKQQLNEMAETATQR
ncbi:uncharacterized protein [Montipora capricornis]|uniref:uncharacterized protein n=1 Tax=Montipora capricornis TaxID=246305 RepID=UPI0035F1D34C